MRLVKIEVRKYEDVYIASAEGIGVKAFGYDEDNARTRLAEVIRFYEETAREMGKEFTSIENLAIDINRMKAAMKLYAMN